MKAVRPALGLMVFFLSPEVRPAFGAEAQTPGSPPPLPAMARCVSRSHPLLPAKWHAIFLMAPFSKTQLTLADIVNDSSLRATRISLFGLRHGSADLFVKGETTYLVAHNGAASQECLSLGDTSLRPMQRDWLAPNAQCDGSAPVNGIETDWWQTPSSSMPSVNRIWYKTDTRSPFRLMFTQPESQLGLLGWYTFSYVARFEPLPESQPALYAELCASARPYPKGTGQAALKAIISEMENAASRNDAEIAQLMPDLEPECPSTPLPSWPDRTRITALMTSPQFKSRPEPTEVLYDWSRKSQLTKMMLPSRQGAVAEEALLIQGHGFSLMRDGGHVLTCAGGLPGPPRPNWPETGGCSCEAAIKGNTELTPSGPVRIFVCPMTPPRVVWSWFRYDGQPTVFMETSAPGDDPGEVMATVDYYSSVPDYAAGAAVFDRPQQCVQSKNPTASAPSSGQGARKCGACHLDEGQ